MSGNRRSIRLPGFDYSEPRYYFVTICTHERRQILANIANGKSNLTRQGKIVQQCWLKLRQFFPRLILDGHIIMPDHFHGILKLPDVEPAKLDYSLPSIIRTFKSVSSRKAKLTLWQRNYYEHIVRTEKSLNMIRIYIEMNPFLWEKGDDFADLNLSEEDIDKILAKYPPIPQ